MYSSSFEGGGGGGGQGLGEPDNFLLHANINILHLMPGLGGEGFLLVRDIPPCIRPCIKRRFTNRESF